MKQNKIFAIDYDKCFICQEKLPEWKVELKVHDALLCDDCVKIAENEIKSRNNVLKTLLDKDTRNIFTQTLGAQFPSSNSLKKAKIIKES